MNSDRNRSEERDLFPVTLLLSFPASSNHTSALLCFHIPSIHDGQGVDQAWDFLEQLVVIKKDITIVK